MTDLEKAIERVDHILEEYCDIPSETTPITTVSFIRCDFLAIKIILDHLTGVCEWTQQGFFESTDVWETDCGELYEFNEGTPTDNRCKFCHGCGKLIKEIPWKDDEEEI